MSVQQVFKSCICLTFSSVVAPADPCLKQQDLQTEERWWGSFTEAQLWSDRAWVPKQSECAQQVQRIHQYSNTQSSNPP